MCTLKLQHHPILWEKSFTVLAACAQERVALARYSHLPIGNIGPDWELAAADALYARCLRDAKHVLWTVDPSLPDVALASMADAVSPGQGTLIEAPTMEVTPPCWTDQGQIQIHLMAVH